MLDNCVSTATAKIFCVTHGDNIMSVRQSVNFRDFYNSCTSLTGMNTPQFD